MRLLFSWLRTAHMQMMGFVACGLMQRLKRWNLLLHLTRSNTKKETLIFNKDEIDGVQRWYIRYHKRRRLKRIGLTEEIDLMCTAISVRPFYGILAESGNWKLPNS